MDETLPLQPGNVPPGDWSRPPQPPQPAPKPSRAANDKGSTWGLLAGIALILLLPIILVLGGIFGFFSSSGPGPGGASPQQAINVAPGSPTLDLLNIFKAKSSTADFLKDKGALAADYSKKLGELSQKIDAGDAAYADIKDKEGAKKLIADMIAQLTTIQTAANANDKDTLTTTTAAFLKNIETLSGMVSVSIVSLAQKLAADNAASGYKLYPYDKDRRNEILDTGKGYSDCSSYVDFLLRNAGNRTLPDLNTAGLFTAASNGQYGLSIVKSAPSGLSKADVLANIKLGDIILSANGAYTVGGDAPDNAHAVTYLGNNTIAESTSSGGKDGIQLTTVDERAVGHGKFMAIIRWGGFPQ